MSHIPTPEGLPGIRGLFAFRPETALPMSELVDVLLRGPSTLTPGERELIATYVSAQNDCYYCQTIHGAVAAAHLDGNEDLARKVERARRISRSTTRCSSRPPSACLTAMWTAWAHGLPTSSNGIATVAAK